MPGPTLRHRAALALLWLGVLLALAGCDSSAASRSAGPRIEYGSFHSHAVNGTLHYSIALPPGYDATKKRYPVVYFLHGLPANARAYRNIGNYADSLAATGHSAIVVGAQGARAGDTDPEWHDWGPGRDWETATESELVSWIDHHYRTLPERSARAIIGVSAGGYGATLIGIHHPETYRVIESWSGYFVPTNPAGKPLDLGSAAANAAASAHANVPLLKKRFKRYPDTFFAFYIGRQDPYPGFVDDNIRLDQELTAAGIPHVFELYQGAHDQAFWDMHEDAWLAAAVDRLDHPS
ncbi:MAG TPA: alpha/beta hydrolase-fold protein [Gaiellaceae bacterium]|nr:alpha/beta hydrolase-fold protein [Gaiellaceae bacterium]